MFWSLIYKKIEEFFDQFGDRMLPLSRLGYLFGHSSRRYERTNFSFLPFGERDVS